MKKKRRSCEYEEKKNKLAFHLIFFVSKIPIKMSFSPSFVRFFKISFLTLRTARICSPFFLVPSYRLLLPFTWLFLVFLPKHCIRAAADAATCRNFTVTDNGF